ncbi:PilZ domain-containing protein [Thalassotalea ponticola]|uniref:PilZ domain-containing protein n=1 Tax=Thalassotalea ponticola TaxID=1523392 RepID=UPI0025B2C1ED|nr:PilZ domain-containing protein [Thalassotalea ponticola]MDN3652729.1 PilZ domain-containing protein [Thalassotalea ponticola]
MNKFVLNYKSERELYMAYMPFVKQGGLFIKTAEQLDLDAPVQLSITLPGELEPVALEASVCWVNPYGAQNGTDPGVGVAFVNDEHNVRNQIESKLGRMLNSKDPTYTM